MRSANIVTIIVGTRPEAIKLAPVVHALARIGIRMRILFTGQHPLRPDDFACAGVNALALDCPGGGDPFAHSQNVAQALIPLLRGIRMLVVQGDTSSALGGAIAARQAGIALAHVEAGLRSHDSRAPWPEEDFRVAIDRHSDLLFAPTRLSAANLRRERVGGEIHVTGNTAIDALLPVVANECGRNIEPAALPAILVTCHRRENWGAGLANIAEALRRIADLGEARIELILHPNPVVAAAMRDVLTGRPGITILPPATHREMLDRMVRATLILSDSGGLQEEAPVLGVPLLILRDTSERPEAIVSGLTEMVGTDPDRIVAAVRRRLASPRARTPAFPHGDGQAAGRIAMAIRDWLAVRDVPAAETDSTDLPTPGRRRKA